MLPESTPLLVYFRFMLNRYTKNYEHYKYLSKVDYNLNDIHNQEMEKKAILLYSALEIILLVLAIEKQYRESITSTMYDIYCIVSTFVILCTLCNLVTQLHNLLDKNWECDIMQILKFSFKYNTSLLIVIAICGTFVVTQMINKEYLFDYTWRCNGTACTCLFCFVLIPFTILTSSQQDSDKDVNFMNGLDYGTGMAYNYYYGYLRIILPSTGMANKGILEKIENFEDSHNVSVAIQKLFILIPSSTYVPPDLKELSCQWMESVQSLEEEIRDRAGVKNRSYHNNIYKIYPGGKKSGVKPEYAVVEGATPMLTFFEVQKHFHPESAVYRKYREQIISAFYIKLKELIYNDPDCKDLCELIYYKDYESNGIKVNVAKIILERIALLKNSQ